MRGLWVLVVLASACAHAPPASEPPSTWRYEVEYEDGVLAVQASFPAGGDHFVLEAGESGYVEALRATLGDGRGAEVHAVDDGWVVTGCGAYGCQVYYRYDLRASGRAGARSPEQSIAGLFDARAKDLMFAAPPARWLVRPVRIPREARYRFHVRLAGEARFVSGVSPALDGAPDTYEAPAGELPNAPYSAFGPIAVHTYRPPGARVQLAYPARMFPRGDEPVLQWVERAVGGVASYFGAFPVRHAVIILIPTGERGVYFGAARGNGGASVQVLLGPASDRETYEEDWVLVHETVHLGFPNLPSAQRWLEEGLATYLETIIRARLGLRTEVELWGELLRSLPQGKLDPSDGGYNRSTSWAHMYWGGALFCFLADVQIRARTQGARSLADAVRAVQDAGGTIEGRWRPERVVAVADAATGVPVLAELWRDLAEGARPEVDLDAVFGRLGVSSDARGRVTLDDAAPWASIRRAMAARFEDAPIVRVERAAE